MARTGSTPRRGPCRHRGADRVDTEARTAAQRSPCAPPPCPCTAAAGGTAQPVRPRSRSRRNRPTRDRAGRDRAGGTQPAPRPSRSRELARERAEAGSWRVKERGLVECEWMQRLFLSADLSRTMKSAAFNALRRLSMRKDCFCVQTRARLLAHADLARAKLSQAFLSRLEFRISNTPCTQRRWAAWVAVSLHGHTPWTDRLASQTGPQRGGGEEATRGSVSSITHETPRLHGVSDPRPHPASESFRPPVTTRVI